MYKVKSQNIEELKEGRTITYLAELTGYARTYINSIFTGRILIEEETAKKILIAISKESYKINEKLQKYGIETMIEHFFKKVE